MARYKNVDWNFHGNESDTTVPVDRIKMALLMDIRDELQRLNTLLHCPNFMSIPHKLDRIEKKLGRVDRRLAKKVPLR